jgi:N-acetylmuramoyl-L-alanine amidase
MREVNEIIIHCSATPNGRFHTAADINRWHKERGWDLIGYHWVIRTTGEIEAGRPEWMPGAGVKGRNSNTIHICMIGTDEYSDEQWKSLRWLVDGLMFKYKATVHGHNEFSNKKCPGFNVQWWANKENLTVEGD